LNENEEVADETENINGKIRVIVRIRPYLPKEPQNQKIPITSTRG